VIHKIQSAAIEVNLLTAVTTDARKPRYDTAENLSRLHSRGEARGPRTELLCYGAQLHHPHSSPLFLSITTISIKEKKKKRRKERKKLRKEKKRRKKNRRRKKNHFLFSSLLFSYLILSYLLFSSLTSKVA
jgi:hypothetical protein